MATLTPLDDTHGFTAGDLDTSGQVAWQPAYQKIYIADGRPYSDDINDSGYHILDFINTRLVGASTGGSFQHGDVVTQATSGASGVFDEVVDRGSGVTWNLIYRTTTVEFDTTNAITSADRPGVSLTPSAVVSPPHWLNWTLEAGTFPDGGSNVMSLCWGRVFLNSLSNPHQWFGTRKSNPRDLLLVQDDVASAINSQAQDQSGLVGDQIVAYIPYIGNYQIFGCINTMYVLRADPASGGKFSKLCDSSGIFGSTAWCWDDKGNLYWLGNDGIYVVSAETILTGGSALNITKEHLPLLVNDMGLNRRTDRVTMAYDKDRYGIQVSVSQFDRTWSAVFWIDLRTGGLFPDRYNDDHVPASLYYFDARRRADRKLLAGCYDGYIRNWSNDQKTDDGETIVSKAVIGPITSDDLKLKVKLNELAIKTGLDTDTLSVGLYAATTASKLIEMMRSEATPKIVKTFLGNRLMPSLRQIISDGALGILLFNDTNDSTWSIEEIDADLSESGRIK